MLRVLNLVFWFKDLVTDNDDADSGFGEY